MTDPNKNNLLLIKNGFPIMSLIRLIYISVTCSKMNLASLQEILSVAEEHNTEKKITGALAYGNSSFLQVLEGSRSEVSALYNHISKDHRHTEVELVEVVPIQTRDFGKWSMRYVYFDEQNNSNHIATIKRIANTDKFTPKLWTAEQSLSVMIALNAN